MHAALIMMEIYHMQYVQYVTLNNLKASLSSPKARIINVISHKGGSPPLLNQV